MDFWLCSALHQCFCGISFFNLFVAVFNRVEPIYILLSLHLFIHIQHLHIDSFVHFLQVQQVSPLFTRKARLCQQVIVLYYLCRIILPYCILNLLLIVLMVILSLIPSTTNLGRLAEQSIITSLISNRLLVDYLEDHLFTFGNLECDIQLLGLELT